MCLAHVWNFESFVNSIAALLSMCIGVGPTVSIPSSEMSCRNQMALRVTAATAIYSASMVESATVVVLKHKNVSSIEEYNIGDRLKYSRIKQSSKKDIEESRINVKYQEHYRSIWNSAKYKVQSAK